MEMLFYLGPKQISEAEAYNRLGRMYMDGAGVPEDGVKACRYFETAYKKGSRDIRTGDFLMMGVYRQIETRKAVMQGLVRDLRLSIKWYTCCLERCIQNEDEHRIYLILSHLGRAFMDDEIEEYKTAYDYLNRASHQEPEALFYLARMYDLGLYVMKDREMAKYYLNMILERPEFEDDVFYNSAQDILECWEVGAPQHVIEKIIESLG